MSAGLVRAAPVDGSTEPTKAAGSRTEENEREEAPVTDERLARILATGLTEAEIEEAAAVGVDMYDLADAREAGATHAEVLEVGALGYELCGYYTELRGAEGATHAEAMVKVQATATLLATRHEANVADAGRLAVLAEHEDVIVRLGVADNRATPPEVLATLANDRWARAAVAGNPSAPPEVLTKLAGYKARTVRSALIGNPSAPPGPLAKLVEYETTYWGAGARRPRARVAPEPPTPPEADQLQM